jgi:hypothetical protein
MYIYVEKRGHQDVPKSGRFECQREIMIKTDKAENVVLPQATNDHS